jgi:hypothetical protein
LEVGDGDQRVGFAAPGGGWLYDDAVDVSGIDGRGYGKLTHVAEGTALGVDYGGPHEGGDARPVIGLLCHGSAAVFYPLYLLSRMLAQLAADGGRQGRSCQNDDRKGTGIGKIDRGTLTFKKSTSTLPSIPLFEVDNGQIGTKDIFGRL